MDWIYTDIVKKHFTEPQNVLMEDESAWPCDGRGQTGNIKCGDQMLMLLRIKDDVITDCRWKTYGCASAIASTSILSGVIKGMDIRSAYNIKPEDIVKELGGLPEHKIHCSVLGDKALRAAIDDYLAKTGRAGMLKVDAVEICHCLGITDKDIEAAYKSGTRNWEQLQSATKIGTSCGKCQKEAMEYLHSLEHIYG
ncbi:MAG: iron-sulfur cluster assembly scaffold protein [Spirochaetaceae bacterium]|jgi:nitrogen fixation NifU-like protein|nr:iron-sulfur cluster assembly scaffold protein [Spirochaetaceae bacterium]